MGFTVRLSALLITIICLHLPQPGWAQSSGYDLPGGPLRVRNVSPIVQLYGLPRMIGARVLTGSKEISFNLEAANNFQSDNRQGTFAFFDGESYLSSYRMRGLWQEGLEWGVEIPHVVHTGGGLDGLVDEFHELFGLPDGERSLASRGRLDYLLRSRGVVYADFSDSRRALGDVRGFVGYQLINTERDALAIRGQIKLPTGNVGDLSGSEGTDISIWGEYEYSLPLSNFNLRFSLAGGLSFLGEGELIPEDQESWVSIGHVGIQLPLHPRFELHAQLDAHSNVLRTGNPLVADGGVLGTIGGRVGLTRTLWLDFALIEDLDNKSASDIVFQIMLGTRL